MLELEKSNLILHLIRKKTKSDKVPLQKLCYGICDISYISRAITNHTEVDKLILDALMQRLGISTENYIYMLRDSEYEYFVCREQIRTCIQENRIEKAKILLETYMDMQKKIKGAKKLHNQMALLLRSYILEKEAVDINLQLQNIEEGIACTMEKVDTACLDEFLFSEVELLLLLRKAMLLENMQREQEAYELYYQLYHLYRTKSYLMGRLTYIFVVVGYHLAKICIKKRDYYLAQKIAQECIEDISNGNRILFLPEFLEMVDTSALKEEQLIKDFVVRYFPHWKAEDYFPMYREFSVYSFREIVLQRRKKLGLTQEELSEKCCCDVSTIQRMEQGKMDTQSAIAYKIRTTLKIPMEKTFYYLQTSDCEVKEKYSDLLNIINEHKIVETKELLEKLSVSLDESFVLNHQAMEFGRYAIWKLEGKMSLEQEIGELKKILMLTIPTWSADETLNIILYPTEIDLIRNIAMCYEDNGEPETAIRMLENIRSVYMKKNNVGAESMKTYLPISRQVESIYANMGNFEKANEILEECIELAVKYDVAGVIPSYLYDKAWNMQEQKGTLDEEMSLELKVGYELAKLTEKKRIMGFMEALCPSVKS